MIDEVRELMDLFSKLGTAVPPGYARPFVEMADRIVKMNQSEFAGAVVIVPPAGEPIVFLTADPKPDMLQFLIAAKTRIEIRERELIQAAQAQDPWRAVR